MKTGKIIYDRRRNIYYEEDISAEEAMDQKRRIRNILRAEDARIEQLERDKSRRGYCPKCRILLPVSGKCFCGYQRPSTATQTPVSTRTYHKDEVKAYVNPAILAMYK